MRTCHYPSSDAPQYVINRMIRLNWLMHSRMWHLSWSLNGAMIFIIMVMIDWRVVFTSFFIVELSWACLLLTPSSWEWPCASFDLPSWLFLVADASPCSFDETDGSQKEQVNVEIVGNEEAPHKAIKKLAIGEVKPIKDEDDDNIVHVNLDPTTRHVSSNEHGEDSATRNDQDGRSNETQGHSHEDGVNNKQAQLNSTMKKEVKTTLQLIMTMMMKMMSPFKDQLKCHILECINPFNGIILLRTYWGASDEG